jgi:hypothetical protein
MASGKLVEMLGATRKVIQTHQGEADGLAVDCGGRTKYQDRFRRQRQHNHSLNQNPINRGQV